MSWDGIGYIEKHGDTIGLVFPSDKLAFRMDVKNIELFKGKTQSNSFAARARTLHSSALVYDKDNFECGNIQFVKGCTYARISIRTQLADHLVNIDDMKRMMNGEIEKANVMRLTLKQV